MLAIDRGPAGAAVDAGRPDAAPPPAAQPFPDHVPTIRSRDAAARIA
jgi:hypothetical protein